MNRVALGVLLACGAMSASAGPEAARPTGPAPLPMDYSVRQAAVPAIQAVFPPTATASVPVGRVDYSLRPAAVPATTPAAAPVDVLQSASDDVRRMARWVVESGDNARLPFLLIDKVNAHMFVFGPAGQLKGAAPVLLGMARGDRMIAPNSATMEQMPPQVRITPAGRFVSRLGIDADGKQLLVLDYEASLSLHPVATNKPEERRVDRLNSATVEDNRISFGCINVPTDFYASIVSPAFTGTKGIVYVLPETRTTSEVFGLAPVDTAVAGTASNGGAAATSPSAAVTSPTSAPGGSRAAATSANR